MRGEYVILDKDIAEFDSLKSQIVIAKAGRGGSRNLPYAFTEHGVLMLASVHSFVFIGEN